MHALFPQASAAIVVTMLSFAHTRMTFLAHELGIREFKSFRFDGSGECVALRFAHLLLVSAY